MRTICIHLSPKSYEPVQLIDLINGLLFYVVLLKFQCDCLSCFNCNCKKDMILSSLLSCDSLWLWDIMLIWEKFLFFHDENEPFTFFFQVLRFYAIWDDTWNMFGERRRFIIHYYLADDTVEVREVHERNDGRDPFPVLIRRQRLPKTFLEKKGTNFLWLTIHIFSRIICI